MTLRQVCSHAADERSLCAQRHDKASQRAVRTQQRTQNQGQYAVQLNFLCNAGSRESRAELELCSP